MRGNTFTALTMNQTATIWDDSEFRGRCGTIKAKRGIGCKGKGWVDVLFSNGEMHTTAFDKVALGDNSGLGD